MFCAINDGVVRNGSITHHTCTDVVSVVIDTAVGDNKIINTKSNIKIERNDMKTNTITIYINNILNCIIVFLLNSKFE